MNKTILYPLLIVIASSSYGILSTIVKLAMQHGFTAMEAITSQYAIGFALAFIVFMTTERQLPKISKAGFFTLLLAGILTSMTSIIYGKALIFLPASLAVVMLFQFTWMGLFIDCLLHKRLPTRPQVFSLVFLFIGTILAAGLLDVDLSQIPWQGWAFGLASALSFALFIQVNSRYIEGISTSGRLFMMAGIAFVVTSLFLNPEIIWNGKLFEEGLWKYGLSLGFFGIILPIYLFSIAAPKVGGALTSILSAMELPVAVTISVIILDEKLTWLQIMGICFVLAGMILPTALSFRKNR